MKRVSVILAVFNEKLEYLKRCVESTLNQSYENIGFIIIDDSTDRKVIDCLTDLKKKDDRIIYVHNDVRVGFVKSLNKGLALATGEFIARVDSDDIQREDRFERQVEFLERHKDIGIVGSLLEKIGENGEQVGIRYYPLIPELVKRKMMIKNTLAHGAVMMRKSVIDILGGYNEEFERAEDYEMWMRAIKKGIKITNLPESLMSYRISDTVKRDTLNWKNNLKVKLENFGFDCFGCRIIGILIISLMLILPSFLRKLVYSAYNKLA